MKPSPISTAVVASKIRREWHHFTFSRVVRHITAARPLVRGTQPLTVLSMVQSRDTLPYLLALHSFARHINPQRVVVVCDPSMTADDLATLRASVPHIELRRAEEFRRPELPVGGCWERLSAITEYAQTDYVVQLDADTVTRSDIAEVRAAVLARLGFVLGESPGQTTTSIEAAGVRAAAWQRPGMHVQSLSEFTMPQARLQGTRYVRGCAGFTGFTPTPDLGRRLTEFSLEMRRLTGARWSEWGTEQVASNYLVANLPGTTVLPFPAYGTPDRMADGPRFLHFIGSMRFTSSHYTRLARELIGDLRAG